MDTYCNGPVSVLPLPGENFIAPVSFATVVGAFMFGIGMVISGGCASRTLMRVGEGFQMQALSILFFIVGSLWGAHNFGWWKLNVIIHGRPVFLPDLFGWIGAIAVQLLIIALLWTAVDKWYYFSSEGAQRVLENGILNDAGSMRNFGIIAAALMATLLASGFKIKKIKSWKQVVPAIMGGLLRG